MKTQIVLCSVAIVLAGLATGVAQELSVIQFTSSTVGVPEDQPEVVLTV